MAPLWLDEHVNLNPSMSRKGLIYKVFFVSAEFGIVLALS